MKSTVTPKVSVESTVTLGEFFMPKTFFLIICRRIFLGTGIKESKWFWH
jgi:hypothetical protein